MDASIKTKYVKSIELTDTDYAKFSKDTASATSSINRVLSNPWLRVVSLETVVTLVVEPDPNLSEQFWCEVALQKYKYTTFRETWMGTWLEHYFG